MIDWKKLNPIQPSEAEIIANKKAGKIYVADFHYCSCYGLYDETTSSVINGFKLLTDKRVNTFKEHVWIDKAKHMKYLNTL